MRIKIISWDTTSSTNKDLMTLKQAITHMREVMGISYNMLYPPSCFDVIDEKKFFLSVIEYGIEYEEIKE